MLPKFDYLKKSDSQRKFDVSITNVKRNLARETLHAGTLFHLPLKFNPP